MKRKTKPPKFVSKADTVRQVELCSPVHVLALAVETQDLQGFIRSGEGYTEYGDDHEIISMHFDNKTMVIQDILDKKQPTAKSLEKAQKIIEKFEAKFVMKKLTTGLNNFEEGVVNSFSSKKLGIFNVAVLASIPNMHLVDKKRKKIEDKLEEVRFSSRHFGVVKQRYDLSVYVIDSKYIQKSAVYMITALYNGVDIIKFWWRDQPDLSDMINESTVHIRGTVNKHEIGRFTHAQETFVNRVQIIQN